MRDRRALDRALVRLADGDRAAFDEVFAAVTPPARALARRLLAGSAADGEDAVQEAVIKIFARAHQYDPTRDGLTWALAIVAWECRTIRRRAERSRTTTGAPLEHLADGACSPEARAIDDDLRAALAELVGELAPADQAVVRAAWSGETADGVAPATMRKRLQRALDRLRGAWRTRHGT